MISRRSLLAALPLALPGPRSTLAAPATPNPDGYSHPDWLIDPAGLQTLLAADLPAKVIALGKPEDFAAGHIPGAASIDWPDLEIVETSNEQIAGWRDAPEAKLTALGLAPTDTVVVYDPGTLYAARLWWILHQLGHARNVILDGGLDAWNASGGQLETGPSTAAPAPHPYRGAPNDAAIAAIDEAIASYDRPGVVFLDARRPDEYAAGHIPGAVNIEFTRNMRADPPKTWKPAPDLLAMYADAGVTLDQRVIPYCTTGVRSAATYFTLRLIGFQNVALFTCSFKEWSSRPDLPVATGDQP